MKTPIARVKKSPIYRKKFKKDPNLADKLEPTAKRLLITDDLIKGEMNGIDGQNFGSN